MNAQPPSLNQAPDEDGTFMEVIVLSGMAGSGKSIALNALEDIGYFCVDNLPAEMITDFIRIERQHKVHKIAISIDVRTAHSLDLLPEQIKELKADERTHVSHFFFDAQNETLIKRFSETRRKHPLLGNYSGEDLVLGEAIAKEREMVAHIRAGDVLSIDTTRLRPSELQTYIKTLVNTASGKHNMTLVFESFAFKNGLPLDANFVLDVRVLPNPYYDLELRPLTGRDLPVKQFLDEQEPAQKMFGDISKYLTDWLPASAANHRSYVKVCIGCTGGQHRSVYLVERLYEKFTSEWMCIKRHRELNNVVEASNFSPYTA